MTWYQILCLVGVPTLSTLIVTFIFNYVVNGSKRALERSKKRRQDDIREVVQEELKPIKEDLQLTKEGNQAELRHDIRDACRRCVELGYKSEEDEEEVARMFKIYEKLGTNGVTNKLFQQFENLPMLTQNQIKDLEKRQNGKR